MSFMVKRKELNVKNVASISKMRKLSIATPKQFMGMKRKFNVKLVVNIFSTKGNLATHVKEVQEREGRMKCHFCAKDFRVRPLTIKSTISFGSIPLLIFLTF